MEGHEKMKKFLLVLCLSYFSSFVLMVTSICTSSWYTTHPLAPTKQTSFGSVGLVEHCSKARGLCIKRMELLNFSDEFWPYRPLKNKDFDITLLLLIISMMFTLISLGLTLLSRTSSCYSKCKWLKRILLGVSLISAAGIAGISYLDVHIRSEQFRPAWSSYVAWVAVGLSILVNFPVFYIIRLHESPPLNKVNLQDVLADDWMDEKYTLSLSTQQLAHSHMKDFLYHDIHDVE